MPTILWIGPYRFFFYSNENFEPPHVHIQRDNCLAKFWIDPVSLAKSTRFSSKELRNIQKVVEENLTLFAEKWNEYFKN